MNKKKLPTPLILLIATASMSVIAVIFRLVLTSTVLDVYGLYTRDSVLPTAFHILLTVFVIGAVAFAFLTVPGRTDAFKPAETFLSLIANFTVGFLFCADALTQIYGIFTANSARTTFDTLELLFAIPSAVFFLAQALKPKFSPSLTAFLALFPTAWSAVCLIRIYFDKDLLMTDPGRILEQVALLAAMVAFLTEARTQLNAFSHRFFLAAVSAAPVLLFAVSIPDLLFYDKLMIGSSDSPVRTALCFAFALFFLSKLYSYARTPDRPSANDKSASEPSNLNNSERI